MMQVEPMRQHEELAMQANAVPIAGACKHRTRIPKPRQHPDSTGKSVLAGQNLSLRFKVVATQAPSIVPATHDAECFSHGGCEVSDSDTLITLKTA
eukprot:6250000-Amphidinium_carterae.1